MSKETFYKKLKDYIYVGEHSTTSIFGTLHDKHCIYLFKNSNGEQTYYNSTGNYNHDMDFLVDYYVIGINSCFKIDDHNTIQTYLLITLSKEKESWEELL